MRNLETDSEAMSQYTLGVVEKHNNTPCLKYKVGLNLLYPKIGEIDPYAMQQWIRVQGTMFVT